MTTLEKVRFVNLASGDGYENHNSGDARLCIPMLTLEDGPNGIAYNDSGVTQLPASPRTRRELRSRPFRVPVRTGDRGRGAGSRASM